MVHGFNFDNLFCITSRYVNQDNPMDKTGEKNKIKWIFEIFEKKVQPKDGHFYILKKKEEEK